MDDRGPADLGSGLGFEAEHVWVFQVDIQSSNATVNGPWTAYPTYRLDDLVRPRVDDSMASCCGRRPPHRRPTPRLPTAAIRRWRLGRDLAAFGVDADQLRIAGRGRVVVDVALAGDTQLVRIDPQAAR